MMDQPAEDAMKKRWTICGCPVGPDGANHTPDCARLHGGRMPDIMPDYFEILAKLSDERTVPIVEFDPEKFQVCKSVADAVAVYYDDENGYQLLKRRGDAE